jgi:tetratricopeptide (TPR) repeat protein
MTLAYPLRLARINQIYMDPASINQLLQALQQENESVRDMATQTLWRVWFEQKGMIGLELLQRSQRLLQLGQLSEALTLLDQLIQDMPDFAEAWNRRAVVHFSQHNYRQAIDDCHQVLQLNPSHFGASHGLGLCHAALGEHSQAIQAFHRTLEIQPYWVESQRLILECTAHLSQ